MGRNLGDAGCYVPTTVVVLMTVVSLTVASAELVGLLFAPIGNKSTVLDEGNATAPVTFVVNNSYLTPSGVDLSHGSGWLDSSLFLFESQYRHQGIINYMLNDDECLLLSDEAIGRAVAMTCAKHSEHSLCAGTERAIGITSDGRIAEFVSFAKEFDEFKKYILPMASCPFQNVSESLVSCSMSAGDASVNPLKFGVTGGESITGVENVKELLRTSGKPIALSIPKMGNRYWAGCSDEKYASLDMCTGKYFVCPGTETSFCVPVDYFTDEKYYVEPVFRRFGDIAVGSQHEMAIVGYSDFVEPMSVNISRRMSSKGGFILRNPWGGRGHSIDYLSGAITKDQESSLCPNNDDPMSWVPATLECMKSEKDPMLCSADIKRQERGGLSMGAHALECINETHCNLSKMYVLMRNPTSNIPLFEIASSGMTIANVIEYDDEGGIPVVKQIRSLPFEQLYEAFAAHHPRLGNDAAHCGYSFVHYDTLDRLSAMNASSWYAMRVDVEWERGSFARSGARNNYTRVLESTMHYRPPKAKSPEYMFPIG